MSGSINNYIVNAFYVGVPLQSHEQSTGDWCLGFSFQKEKVISVSPRTQCKRKKRLGVKDQNWRQRQGGGGESTHITSFSSWPCKEVHRQSIFKVGEIAAQIVKINQVLLSKWWRT